MPYVLPKTFQGRGLRVKPCEAQPLTRCPVQRVQESTPGGEDAENTAPRRRKLTRLRSSVLVWVCYPSKGLSG